MEIGLEVLGIKKVEGPLIFLEPVKDVSYDEFVEIELEDGSIRHGRVLETGFGGILIQVFEGTFGIPPKSTKVKFTGKPLMFGVSESVLGRIFNGRGEPIDGLPNIVAEEYRNVNGSALNPSVRAYPRDFIQTGISAIDVMNTLVRGQKLPIFSGAGLPHNELALQIALQAKVRGQEEQFAIIFAAMGVKYDDAIFFKKTLEESGNLSNTVMFINLANDPVVERLLTPRIALTVAEYLAFEKNYHVLVILTDMTNYCEALREVATALGEVPARKGFPGYMYSDLATIYERAGRVKGKEGSVTQIPILTMPNDDITHPIPDLTGYITEGQIVLSRDLYTKGIYPPIDVLPSLSRLMKDGIGEGKTRWDHPRLFMQLYASYSRVKEVRDIASIVGEEELSMIDKLYLKFGDAFETKFIAQGFKENRSLEYSLDLAWDIISILPADELTALTPKEINAFYRGEK